MYVRVCIWSNSDVLNASVLSLLYMATGCFEEKVANTPAMSPVGCERLLVQPVGDV